MTKNNKKGYVLDDSGCVPYSNVPPKKKDKTKTEKKSEKGKKKGQ